MSCQEYEEMLSAYIDGELPLSDKQTLEGHLPTCDECRQALFELRTVKTALRSVPQVDVPQGLHSRIMRNLKLRRAGLFAEFGQRFSGWTLKQWVPAMAAVMVLLVFVSMGGTYWYLSGGSLGRYRLFGAGDQAAAPNSNLSLRGAAEGTPSLTGQSQGTAATPLAKDASVKGFGSLDIVLPDMDRKIIERAQISIQVNRAGARPAAEAAQGIVRANAGYIESSSISRSQQGQNEFTTFYMVARVPQENLDRTIVDLSALGKPTRQDTSAQDITDQYVDLGARLRNSENQEQRLLQIMGEAKTVGELLQVEGELSRVRGNIESMTAQMQRYDKSVSLASVSFEVTEEGAVKPPSPSPWGDVWRAFVNAWRSLLVFLARIAPTVIVCGAAILVVAMVLRKRRTT